MRGEIRLILLLGWMPENKFETVLWEFFLGTSIFVYKCLLKVLFTLMGRLRKGVVDIKKNLHFLRLFVLSFHIEGLFQGEQEMNFVPKNEEILFLQIPIKIKLVRMSDGMCFSCGGYIKLFLLTSRWMNWKKPRVGTLKLNVSFRKLTRYTQWIVWIF